MSKAKTTSLDLMAASDDGEPVKPEKDRKFVEALSRGLDVLRAFSQGSVILGNQDIARLTGLPKPTISRMTYTLTKLGYLSYSTQLEKYQLSSGVLALGYAYVSNLKVRQLAKPYMDEFARQTNMSVGLTCRDRLHMIYVENRLPPEASLLRMDIGIKLPMSTTSAGRAYYCSVSDKGRKVIEDAMELKYGPESWPEKKEGLDRAMEDFKQYGFCLSIGEWDRNINSAGVPVHLQDGTIMTLTCAAPSYLVSAEKLRGSIAHQLAMLASDIETLGV
ncbi:IclR family transcriptional regulator [Marinobacter sp. AC-23]|nr:IclR family transcriptional regulator [Marinobacter sp. AC-23]